MYNKKNLLILAYHRVNVLNDGLSVRPNEFEKQIFFLKESGFRTLLLKDYIHITHTNGSLDKGRYVVITFDDGWEDNYTYGFPILKKYGYRATIFLTVSKIGKDKDYLTWDQVKEMMDFGFEFGSHTLTHPHLTKIPLEKARLEIIESKNILEKRLKQKIETFCYPYGDYDKTIVELVKDAGYRGAVVTPKYGKCNHSMYTICRIGLYNSDTYLSFRIKISWVRNIAALNRGLWLFLKRIKKWTKV